LTAHAADRHRIHAARFARRRPPARAGAWSPQPPGEAHDPRRAPRRLGLSPTPEHSATDEHEYVPDDYDDRPTRRQLAYLRSLANRAGQTFAYPRTAAQASREIRRLKNARPSYRLEREFERQEIADAIASGPDDAVRVRDTEIQSYGVTATWRERS
jgi:hypothetical protein